MIIKQTLAALAVACPIVACGGSASGQVGPEPVVLFDNFGKGNSYQVGSGVGFGGSNPQFEQAMAFIANDHYLLTTGEFGVSLSFGLSAAFEITVHADANGLPGAVLEQATVRDELGPFGSLNPPVVADFAGTTLLSAGEQYWISMSAGASTQAVWNHNDQGDLGPRAFSMNGGPWNLFSETDARGAFRLHGTLVPAPGAIGLLGVFACARCGRRRVPASRLLDAA